MEYNNSKEMLKGFLDLKDTTYTFSYIDKVLSIYPNTEEEWKKNQMDIFKSFAVKCKGSVINNINLSGILANGQNIIFNISEQGSNNNGFLSYNVNSYYIYRKNERYYRKKLEKRILVEEENHIDEMVISGRDIDLFLNPALVYNSAIMFDENESKNVFYINTPCEAEEKFCGKLEWKDLEINIFVHSIVTMKPYMKIPLVSKSELILKFSNSITVELMETILMSLKQCFVFICRRFNIKFKSVRTISYSSEGKKIDFGKYIVLNSFDEEETNVNIDKRIISYEFLKNKFAILFKVFLEEKMYINNIPNNISEVNKYGPERIIFNFVAFEREYQNLYPETATRSQEFLDAKQKVIESIDELINNNSGKRKKYLKSFQKSIKKIENSFGGRLKEVIIDDKEYMIPFLIHNYGKDYESEIEEFCTRMNDLRNDSAHGNFIIATDINREIVFDFEILECLLYIMRLKDIGLSVFEGRRAVAKLMGINIDE